MVENLAVVNNESEQRYEAEVDGALAIAEYRRHNNEIIFFHTEVPVSLRGKGVGTSLVKAALDDARAQGLAVKSTCWFVSDHLRRHPE